MNDESFILLITEGEKLDVKILNQVKIDGIFKIFQDKKVMGF